jgi:hypothetical protein
MARPARPRAAAQRRQTRPPRMRGSAPPPCAAAMRRCPRPSRAMQLRSHQAAVAGWRGKGVVARGSVALSGRARTVLLDGKLARPTARRAGQRLCTAHVQGCWCHRKQVPEFRSARLAAIATRTWPALCVAFSRQSGASGALFFYCRTSSRRCSWPQCGAIGTQSCSSWLRVPAPKGVCRCAHGHALPQQSINTELT